MREQSCVQQAEGECYGLTDGSFTWRGSLCIWMLHPYVEAKRTALDA